MSPRFVPLRAHAAADFLVGATFFGLPLLYDLPPPATAVSWAVAAVHLAMTLLTDYPAGLLKLIPLEAHLTAELVGGPLLVAAPWLAGFSAHRVATAVFVTWGVISFLTYFVTIRSVPRTAD
jgi:hypothetical protein